MFLLETKDAEKRERGMIDQSQSQRLALGPWVVGILLLLFSVPWLFLNPINGDTGFFAASGDAMLYGAKLYRDIVEPNAPPPFLLGLVSAALGRMGGVRAEPALILTIILLIGLALYRATAILRALLPEQPALIGLLVVIALYCLFPNASNKFGEREHILAALVLPWLFGSISGSREGRKQFHRSRAGLMMDGMLAALGIAMKPFFIAIYLGIQLLNLLSPGRRAQVLRLDNLLIAASQAALVAITILLFPDYLTVVRMAMATYHGSAKPLIELCTQPAAILLVAVSIASVAWGRGRPLVAFRTLFLGAAWCDAAIVLYQREGFAYHYFPLELFTIVALATLLADAIRATGRDPGRLLSYALLPLIALVGIAVGTERRPFPKQTGPLLSVVEREAKDKPVLVLSTSLWVSSPLLRSAGATYTWRFRSLWGLGALYPDMPAPGSPRVYRTRSEMGEAERYLLDSLAEDMRRNPPQLIVVESGEHIEGFRDGKFDYLDYFLHDDRFARAFANYDPVPNVAQYKLYRRRQDVN